MGKLLVPAACVVAVVGTLATGCADSDNAQVPAAATSGIQEPQTQELPEGVLPESATLYAINQALDHDMGLVGVEPDEGTGGYVIEFLGDHDQSKIDRAERALKQLDLDLAFEFTGAERVVFAPGSDE